MKNYDIESIKKELPLGRKIVLKSKKVAYLVPHVFQRVKSGFYLKYRELKNAIIPDGVIQETKAQAESAAVDYATTKSENYEQKVSALQEQRQVIENTENITENEKAYLLHVTDKDIEKYKNKAVRVLKTPRPLRISGVFLSKVFTNIHKKRQEARAIKNEFKKMDVNDPVLEYINLMNERTILMDKFKEPIDRIKEVEGRLMELVKSGQVTKEKLNEYSGMAQEATERVR